MKLFDVIKQSVRMIIQDEEWVMDTSTFKYLECLRPDAHFQFAKILHPDIPTNLGHFEFQCFVHDQDITIDINGQAQIKAYVVSIEDILKSSTSHDGSPPDINGQFQSFKFTFYKEVLFSSDTQTEENSKNYQWLLENGNANDKLGSRAVVGNQLKMQMSFSYWGHTPASVDELITQKRKAEHHD